LVAKPRSSSLPRISCGTPRSGCPRSRGA
jgi:hypothetical protein